MLKVSCKFTFFANENIRVRKIHCNFFFFFLKNTAGGSVKQEMKLVWPKKHPAAYPNVILSGSCQN